MRGRLGNNHSLSLSLATCVAFGLRLDRVTFAFALGLATDFVHFHALFIHHGFWSLGGSVHSLGAFDTLGSSDDGRNGMRCFARNQGRRL